MVVANFFWHGSPLSLYEKACLSSFVQRGFDVHLYSFDLDMDVPEGVSIADARIVARLEEASRYTQGGKEASVTSFSNIFRYRLLAREGGWWFDMDVFCLADSEYFLELQARSPGLVAAFESENWLNNGILYVSALDCARELVIAADAKGRIIPWGAIGRDLLTEYLRTHPDRVAALPSSVFYPIHFSEVQRFYEPELKQGCMASVRDSLCVHFWNEIIGRIGISKDIMPCAGSYLEELFTSVGAESAPHARLPIDMIRLPRRIETLEKKNQRYEEENARLRFDLSSRQADLRGLQERIGRIYTSKTWRLGSLVRKLAKPLLVLWGLGRRIVRALTSR